MNTVLRTEQVTKYYSSTEPPVLDGLDFCMLAGKFTVLMGASGSGKSTLLHLLGGLDRPSSGNVIVMGHYISNYNESQLAKFRRKHIGFVFQINSLINQLTVEENILLAGYLVNKSKQAVRQRAKLLMEQLGIAHLAERLPGEISVGEVQRCTVARALINYPKILLADEPTGNLNSKASERVLDRFNELRQAGQSILMVTHDIHSAAFADEVFYINDGAILGHLNLENSGTISQKEQIIKQWLDKVGW